MNTVAYFEMISKSVSPLRLVFRAALWGRGHGRDHPGRLWGDWAAAAPQNCGAGADSGKALSPELHWCEAARPSVHRSAHAETPACRAADAPTFTDEKKTDSLPTCEGSLLDAASQNELNVLSVSVPSSPQKARSLSSCSPCPFSYLG